MATNFSFIAEKLAVACKGHHRHIQLVSGRAKRADIYPKKLCRAIVKGLIEQVTHDSIIIRGHIGSVIADDGEDNYQQYWGDISGEPLDGEGVRRARKEELAEFRKASSVPGSTN